jgi:hypothetical protein
MESDSVTEEQLQKFITELRKAWAREDENEQLWEIARSRSKIGNFAVRLIDDPPTFLVAGRWVVEVSARDWEGENDRLYPQAVENDAFGEIGDARLWPLTKEK